LHIETIVSARQEGGDIRSAEPSNRDISFGTSDLHRQIDLLGSPLVIGAGKDDLGLQISSSHRTTSTSGLLPGSTFNSLRTSR
jgi:hypothetical protein